MNTLQFVDPRLIKFAEEVRLKGEKVLSFNRLGLEDCEVLCKLGIKVTMDGNKLIYILRPKE